jgi:hypothetical protein
VVDNQLLHFNDMDRAVARHFSAFYAAGEGVSVVIGCRPAANDPIMHPTTMSEMISTLRAMGQNKATLDGVTPAVILTHWSEATKAVLLRHLNDILMSQHVPPCLSHSLIIPIPKLSSSPSVSDFRPISITPCILKLLNTILNNRLVAYITQHGLITDNQHGFLPGKSASAPLFVVEELIADALASKKRKSLFVATLDVSKAFDSVPHDLILSTLADLGFSNAFCSYIRNLYATSTAQMLGLYDGLSAAFHVRRGVKQGDPLSSTLFVLVMNSLSVALNDHLSHHAYTMHSPSDMHDSIAINHGLFADDICILCDNAASVSALITVVSEWLEARSMSLNLAKCQLLCVNSSVKSITFNNHVLTPAKSIKYLGCFFDSRRSSSTQSSKLVSCAKSFQYLLNSKHLSLSQRLTVLSLVLIPRLVYPLAHVPTSRTLLDSLESTVHFTMSTTSGLRSCASGSLYALSHFKTLTTRVLHSRFHLLTTMHGICATTPPVPFSAPSSGSAVPAFLSKQGSPMCV